MRGAIAAPGAWKKALDEFVQRLRGLYGERLKGVILYGSRARGDSEEDSDIDTLVLLEPLEDVWRESDFICPIASDVSLKFAVVLCAFPTRVEDYEGANSPFLLNVRREGIPVG